MYCIHSLGAVTCAQIVSWLGPQLEGRLAVCTSVDSGPGGWAGWTEKVGDCFCRVVDAVMLRDWPTYWGAYDEWYIFDAKPADDFEVIAICNFGGEFISEIGATEDTCDWCPALSRYLRTYRPVCIFGNSEEAAYLVTARSLSVDPPLGAVRPPLDGTDLLPEERSRP
jgi:hypothetical protein